MLLNLGPHQFRVSLQHQLSLYGEPVDGYCDSQNLLIVINADLPFSKRRTVFFHELTHAAVEIFGLTQTQFDEESLCEINGLLMAYITSEIHRRIELFLKHGPPPPSQHSRLRYQH